MCQIMIRLRTLLILAAVCWSTCYAAVQLTTMTGSIQYQVRAATDQNSWVITPSNPKASKIMIIFTALNMIQAEIRIYDTATVNSGSILLNCASCGTSIPPPFYSTSGSITIQSVGTNGVGFQSSNFALQYIGVPTTTTNQLNNTYVNLNMGMAPIQPFLINGILPARTVQQWAIRTNVQIIFSFSEFTFPSDCSSLIQIHNRLTSLSTSSIIFQGCRSSDIPTSWFYSSTGVALVVLTSGTTDSVINFQLNYFSDVDLYRCGSFIQPALLTDTAMIVADGSKSSSLMKRGVDCTWLIKPTQNAPISLVLNQVSLKFGSSLIVYDGSSVSNTVLWNAVGATLTIPPIITSTGNSLFVKYQSDTSNPIKYLGFQGDFTTNFIGSLGSGKGYTQLKMSSALDISPPGDRRTRTAGLRYIWYVSPVGSSGVLTFAVRYLKLTQPGDRLTLLEGVTGNTGGDFGGVVQDLNIGSRTVLATYTGDQLPTDWVRTTGTSATILFESASTSTTSDPITGENFQLAYYSDGPNYHCGFTTNPAVLDLPSFVLTDGSSSIEQAYTNQYCTWQLQPRNATSVVLFFGRFHLYGGYLRIYTGTLAENKLYVEIGETAAAPAPIRIPGGVVSLVYSTRSSAVVGYGFALTYYGVTSSRSFPGDRVVALTSSSALSLSLPPETTTQLASNTSLQWIISPSSASGRIYIALTHLDLSASCDRSYLDIYDGEDYSAPLLGRFCGSTLPASYSWLQTSTRKAMVHFVSDSSNRPNAGNFNLSYFSDGPNFHCGFAVNPARMTAPSMVFSDGSGTLNPLYGDQLCEWLLEPAALPGTTSGGTMLVVLEFTLCDLQGAKIEIFDGPTAQATLLWQCDGCTNLPGPLISSSSKVFVRYSSLTVARFGQGFELLYWTSTAEALSRSSTVSLSTTRLLQMPLEFALTSSADNSTAAFFVQTTTTRSSLFFDPFYALQSGSSPVDITASAVDGRTSPSVFESPATQLPVCGAVRNAGGNSLVGSTLTFNPAQRLDGYLMSSTNFKSTSVLSGVPRDRKQTYENQLSNSFLSASNVCKYRLDSGSFKAIAIQVSQFIPQLNGRLRIYGGLNSEDALIFDSNFPELYMRAGSQQRVSQVNGVVQHSANITAPCGQATIVLEQNNTASTEVDYSLQLIYFTVAADNGELCKQYFDSLQPKPAEKDPLIPVYIAMGAFGAAALIFAVFYYANKLKATQGYLFYPYGLKVTQPRKIVKTIVAYPKYNARWDQYLNTFLRKGECCVCKNSSFIVMRLKCGHALCLEDLKGYLESALGNISMFPVKCPMHFQGCGGAIDARIAKRILTEPQYNRFNEFSDRAVYGDGMRCIHCQNYVNFPDNMEHVARVVCPYCVQSFCVRCKKAWHHGVSCAVETYDTSLEAWKNTSGAQKCPACKKLIEKDDPDTCNHMIHKITDGIPCIRDRTDFCYCCGEEVTGDYPHNEVQNKGVNHFPDGVFQRCRTVVKREKEAERERLRKIRRMKSKQVVPFGGPRGAAAIAAASSETAGNSSVFNPFVSTPPGGNTSLEAMWLLEQQYDIETPVGSPIRPVSRSAAATPLMTPSPGRVHPTGDWDSVPNSPATPTGTGSVRIRPSPSTGSARQSSAVAGNHRIVPTATAAAESSPTQSARNITRNPATRPFSSLEQQILYQQTAIQVARHSNSSSAAGSGGLHGSASSPQLLLGSPQQQQRRSRPSNL